MFRQKMFKRVLPMLLVISMMFQTVSGTALAAEISDAELLNSQTENEETVAEESSVEETEENEVVNEEDVDADVSSDENVSDEVVSDATPGYDEAAALPKAEIELDKQKIRGYLNDPYYEHEAYKYDNIADAMVVDYHSVKDTNVSDTVKKLLSDYLGAISVSVAGKDNDSARDSLKYTWQKAGTDGKYADMEASAAPSAAGSYRLVISLDATTEYAAAEPVSLDLVVKKSVVTAEIYDTYFESGKTAAEVVKAIDKIYFYVNDDGVESVGTDENGNFAYEGTTYIKAVSLKVKNADTGSELKGEDLIKKGVNYIILVEATLKDDVKDNYELAENAFRLITNGSVYTEIKVTYSADVLTDGVLTDGAITAKIYNGQPINAATEVESKYTAKVVYGDNKEITNAKITTSWCNEYYNELSDVPTDAGTYYYKLSYVDEEKAYDSAEAYIPVRIKAVDIVVVPKLSVTNFYSGISSDDVLKNVAYDVYRVNADGTIGTTAEKIDAYFWGVTSGGYSYEPVFAVQSGDKNADGTINWGNKIATTISPAILRKYDDVSYRVVFNDSLKAYYPSGGNAGTRNNVNSYLTNYKVVTLSNLTDAQIAACSQEITLDATKTVEISVDAILKEDKTGENIAKPIVKTYDGKGLYTSMSDYKKAVVSTTGETPSKVAENTDSRLKYRWQEVSFYMDGDTPKEDNNYSGLAFDDVDVEVSVAPYTAGVYRLVVTFEDDSNEYYAAPAYVYYTVKRQDVIVSLSGAPEVYADGVNTIDSFIERLQYTNTSNKSTYVTMGFYPAIVTEDETTGKVTVTKGTNAIEDIDVDDIFDNYSFYVEKKVTGSEGENWERCNSSDKFDAEAEYRLCFEGNYEYLNYNFNQKLGNYNNVVKQNYYDNEPISITVKKTEGKTLTIEVGDITNNTKTYDGKPFDVNEIKKLVTIKDGETVVTDSVNAKYLFLSEWGDGYIPIDSAVHAGYYTLYIEVEADDTYRGVSKAVWDTDFIIEQKTITITPVINEGVKAGSYISNGNCSDGSEIVKNFTVDGLVSGDEGAIEDVYWYVRKSNSTQNYSGYLKSTEEYYVVGSVEFGYEYGDGEDYFDYGYDYSEETKTVGFKPVRAAAEVTEVDYYDFGLVDSADLVSGSFVHTITTKKAIPYESGSGNILRARLYAPYELVSTDYETVVDIEAISQNFGATGVGYVVDSGSKYLRSEYDYNSWSYIYYYIPYIDVAFDASDNSKKEFTILWDTDYTEKYVFDFSNTLLQADFSKAVAPKSIAFNGASTKMVVGDDQVLDVKLTKNQVNDIIYLGYSVDDSTVLHITENGVVTALSKGTTTVNVYPCRDVNGVKTPITGKGVKTAKVKITVSDVETPKISALTPKGSYVSFKYKKPANGYRREIYVLSGKKTVANFEDEIAKVNNGNYSAFVYSTYTSGESTDKGIVTRATSNMLEPSSEYTLYLRNVSKLRTLDDGCQVAVSHAGSVKTFKTTKPQATALSAYFSNNAVQDEDSPSYWYVDFKDKSAQLAVKAKFDARYIYSASDAGNYIWRTLPLSGDDKKVYDVPKLDYSVYNDAKGDYDKNCDIASINNSGKLTFKGVGEVRIRVKDTVSGKTDTLIVDISASPDSVTGKKAKVQPGTTVYLSDFLEYKQGKSKVVDYQNYYADLKTDAKSNDGFQIEKVGDGVYDYEITALKPNATLDITVTDRTVEANGGRPATVKLTSSAVEAVKKLKADTVSDKSFTISFTYPTYYYTFKYEVKDARGSIVYSELEQSEAKWNYDDHWYDYDPKTKQFTYTKSFSSARGIVMLSNYTVTVTAYCDDYPSKAATLKVKTTNIPASYNGLDAETYGGITVTYAKYYKGYNGSSVNYLSQNSELNSGNTYALEATPSNLLARLKMTDTLTWKSTNTKVATIKANAGSYTANLKALKAGETTIEVTSKITKKVIARYKITVKPVGEADDYYGEY